jgi:hypothetical protein
MPFIDCQNDIICADPYTLPPQFLKRVFQHDLTTLGFDDGTQEVTKYISAVIHP